MNPKPNLRIPEILLGKDEKVRWDLYTPPGGDSWVDGWETDIKPNLQYVIESNLKYLELAKTQSNRIADLQKGIVATEEFCAKLAAWAKACEPDTENPRCQAAIRFLQAFSALKSVGINGEEKDACHFDITHIQEDNAHIQDLFTLVQTDRDVDMAMFALPYLEDKYKKKVFRQICKWLRTVSVLLEKVENSRCSLREDVNSCIGEMLTTLKESYATVIPAYKKLAKMSDTPHFIENYFRADTAEGARTMAAAILMNRMKSDSLLRRAS